MKAFFIRLVICLLISGTSFAQKINVDEVPLMVQKAFFLKYPDVKESTWMRKDSVNFAALFKDNNTGQSVAFDKTGKWLETESKIDTLLIPQKIIRVVYSHYGDYKLVSAKGIETFESGTFYEVVITNQKDYIKIKIKPSGEILSRSYSKEQKD